MGLKIHMLTMDASTAADIVDTLPQFRIILIAKKAIISKQVDSIRHVTEDFRCCPPLNLRIKINGTIRTIPSYTISKIKPSIIVINMGERPKSKL